MIIDVINIPFATTAFALLSAYLIPIDSLFPLKRSITTLKSKDALYTIECGRRISAIGEKLIAHTHKIKQRYPNVLIKEALVYFTIEDDYVVPPLRMFVHSHETDSTIYYIHKNLQIYEYDSQEPTYYVKSNFMYLHSHELTLLNVQKNDDTSEDKTKNKKHGHKS
jgi:hypothetical protein